MSDTDRDRLTELEIRLSFQDKLVADLDQFVRALSARLEKVERELADLHAAARSPSIPVGPADDRPPHY